jgi:hypothetical protein
MRAGRVISRLPAGELHVVWHDRLRREGTVILVSDRRPIAHNDAFYKTAIPRWQALGIAAGLQVYPGAGG